MVELLGQRAAACGSWRLGTARLRCCCASWKQRGRPGRRWRGAALMATAKEAHQALLLLLLLMMIIIIIMLMLPPRVRMLCSGQGRPSGRRSHGRSSAPLWCSSCPPRCAAWEAGALDPLLLVHLVGCALLR